MNTMYTMISKMIFNKIFKMIHFFLRIKLFFIFLQNVFFFFFGEEQKVSKRLLLGSFVPNRWYAGVLIVRENSGWQRRAASLFGIGTSEAFAIYFPLMS